MEFKEDHISGHTPPYNKRLERTRRVKVIRYRRAAQARVIRTKIMNKIKLVLVLSSFVSAGDYGIHISDDSTFLCPPITKVDSVYNPIKTSNEIALEIIKYFKEGERTIKIFKTSFANGHINYCGKANKENIYKAFIESAKLEVIKNESDLFDFIYIWGNRKILKIMKLELKNPENKTNGIKRLNKCIKIIENKNK